MAQPKWDNYALAAEKRGQLRGSYVFEYRTAGGAEALFIHPVTEARPLVFYPRRVYVLLAARDENKKLTCVQRLVYYGLEVLAQPVL